MLDKLIEGVLRFLEATYNAWSDQWEDDDGNTVD